MKRGKYEAPYVPKRHSSKKVLAMLLSLVLVIGCVAGRTLAWLTAESGEVKNVFTTSDIGITLSESENLDLKMIPGWTINKDPKATVTAGSEDCWLFVKISESTNPDLDSYISYAIADGWGTISDENTNGEIVIARKVYKNDSAKEFPIIGYIDTKGTAATTDDEFVANKVLVKDTVTKDMMNAFDTNKDGSLSDEEQKALPTLTFTAYAHQLYKTNGQEFGATDAWNNLNPSNN